MDKDKIIKALECCCESDSFDKPNCKDCPADCSYGLMSVPFIQQVLAILKEQELPTELKQKMWNAFYAEEDEYEKKFVGKEEHLNWFTVYRPWLQKGFNIAINVIADWEGR